MKERDKKIVLCCTCIYSVIILKQWSYNERVELILSIINILWYFPFQKEKSYFGHGEENGSIFFFFFDFLRKILILFPVVVVLVSN